MTRAASSVTRHITEARPRRRLIVDTDLGLDDLVALSILRVQQCIHEAHHPIMSSGDQYTPFQISGVTITPGISCANSGNAALLRRLLPSNTPIYVSGNNSMDSSLSWMNQEKPTWWMRTADQVTSFLSSLPPLPTEQPAGQIIMQDNVKKYNDITAEQFMANNMDDPNIDFLCMAPLSTVAGALHLRREQDQTSSSPEATFYVMGGIRSDSKVTKRGESTAPFESNLPPDTETEAIIDKRDKFGEFNFALDIAAARTVLSEISARIIPLEACTLVPNSLRSATTVESATLSSILKDRQSSSSDSATNSATDSTKELYTARSILLKLFQEFGATDTQWDSIAAAIYCNTFDSACTGDGVESSGMLTQIDSRELTLSDLGALSLPGSQLFDQVPNNNVRVDSNHSHWIYPTFTPDDEVKFFHYISFLLYSNGNNYHS